MPDDESTHEKALSEKSLAFFGAVMASVSHELNNVIGIVDQSAGLLEDLLYVAREGQPVPEEKLKKIAERITTQTQRGIGLIKRMNRFAHSTDEPILEFDLNETVENLAELTRRKATLKKAELKVGYGDEPIKITGSPFLLQEVLYACIMQTLIDAEPGDNVSVSVAAQEGRAVMLVEGRKPLSGEVNDLDYLGLMMNRLDGTIESNIEKERIIFRITVPAMGRR